jgi:site-specific recombinase XerD
MDDAMLVRGFTARTRESDLAAVARLAKFYGRFPDQLTPEEVQAYLVPMLREEKLAWSTCGLAVHAFRFLYHTTLQRPAPTFTVPGPRHPQKLPEILSPEEVRRVIESTTNRRQRALLATTYAAGLRVSEVVHLRVTDIDAPRMRLRVEQGKGGKDRDTLLSARLLEELRAYGRAYRPQGGWLFPSRGGPRPMDMTTVQKIYTAAKLRARITKRGGIPALRHAFAPHLLEAGVDLHAIQRLLGHGAIGSTLRDFHLARRTLLATPSPLEWLDLGHLPPPA